MSGNGKVTIYTDGACSGNPGPGGYGVVLLSGKHRKELSGGFRLTTNNRMELMAAIEGLKALKVRSKVTVCSDSQLLVNAMTKGWIQRWQANGWMRNRQTEVINADLWKQLVALCAQHDVEFIWTRGHAGNEENERCDELARQAIISGNLVIDTVYEKSQAPDEPLFDLNEISEKAREEPMATGTSEALGTVMSRKTLMQERVSASMHTYILEVEEAANGSKYLVLDQSRQVDDGYEHVKMRIFKEEMLEFQRILGKLIRFALEDG